MDDQQKLQQMITQLNTYKSQAEMLQKQVEALQQSMAELDVLEKTIDDLQNKDSVESLVPVGGGAFMKAEIKDTSNIIMSIGSGIAVKQTAEEAKVTVESQKDELKDSLDKTLQSLQQVTDVIGQLSPAAEKLMANLQADGQLSQ